MLTLALYFLPPLFQPHPSAALLPSHQSSLPRISDLLTSLTKTLQARGIQIDAVVARSQKVSADVLVKEYNLPPEERKILFQALQLKAQAAVEAVRSAEIRFPLLN